jgi:hypothetical protein
MPGSVVSSLAGTFQAVAAFAIRILRACAPASRSFS